MFMGQKVMEISGERSSQVSADPGQPTCVKLRGIMGEAKRRKALGLMPETHPFEVVAALPEAGSTGEWALEWRRRPEGALGEAAEAALRQSLPSPAGWAADYRTRWVAAGRPTDYLNSAEDVEAIAVPQRLRLSGELLTNFDPQSLQNRDDQSLSQFVLLGGGQALHIREQLVSPNPPAAERWEPLPRADFGDRALKFLMQHPIARERGELQASYQAVQHREGLVMINPEPPAELLGILELLTQTLHGGEAGWEAAHRQMLERTRWADEEGAEVPQGVPAARRLTFELRRRAPLNTPLTTPVGEWGDLVILVGQGSTAFSPDGELWYSYVDPSADPTEAELDDFFTQILDMSTVGAEVMADGTVTWEEDHGLDEEGLARIQEQLLQYTGAGTPSAWAAFAQRTLTEAYEDTAPFLADVPAEQFPVPQGFRLDVPLDAAEDADTPNHVWFESQVTYDGQHWLDLYFGELPAELAALAPGGAQE